METLLGIKGPDFVIVAADTSLNKSIVVTKEDENKIHKLYDNLLMACIGEAGDRVQFTEYIRTNLALYRIRNGYTLKPKSAAHFTRNNLATFLRSRSRYIVNLYLAGYDPKDGPELHYIDYLACGHSVRYGGHGYGGMFCNSVFDRYYRDNLTEEEAYDILKKCIKEIHKRLVFRMPSFNVSVVDKNGIRELPQITSTNLLDYKPLGDPKILK